MSKEFKREISTLLKVRHTNLINFVGVCIEQSTEKKLGKVLILTEYCYGHNLFHMLHEKLSIELSYKQRYKMALDIAKGMNYLHTNEPSIIHRDLKSLNLLLQEEVRSDTDHVQVKIMDFGLSRTDAFD